MATTPTYNNTQYSAPLMPWEDRQYMSAFGPVEEAPYSAPLMPWEDRQYMSAFESPALSRAVLPPPLPQVNVARPQGPWIPNLTPRAWSTVPGSTAAPMAQAMSMNPAAQAQPNSMIAALLQMYSGAGQAPQQAPQQPMQRGMFR